MIERKLTLNFTLHAMAAPHSISPHTVVTLQLQKAELKGMRIKCPHLFYLSSFDGNNISAAIADASSTHHLIQPYNDPLAAAITPANHSH